MSRKQVKAGLSKTNVNAIAGAIGTATLRRLISAFSTSVAYTKGQYTNYNNQLYRFTEDKSAGAWDSTKVESASLNDLINDVNAAVQSVTGKANVIDLVNGSLVVNKALKAKALEVLSELSGSTQDDPFIAQGTGTNNNTSEVSTSPVAKQLEKQGNAVVVNQQVRNPNFNGITTWDVSNGTLSAANNIGTYKITTVGSNHYSNRIAPNSGSLKLIEGHKYLFKFSAKSSKAGLIIWLSKTGGGQGVNLTTVANTWVNAISIVSITGSTDRAWLRISNYTELEVNDEINYKDVYIIDLTQWFNDNIPQDLLDNPDHWLNYDCTDDSYNIGAIKNADGVTLVTIKKNVWDEETETGTINITTGQNETNGNYYRSKNYTRVLPNKDYYFYCGQSDTLYVFYYDQSKNYLGYISFGANNVKTIPSNAVWLRFVNVSRNTYQNNFSLYLVYWKDNDDHSQGMDGDHYNTYLPYEKHEYNTGNEVLRSAGSVKDYKIPDGTIHRLVGAYTFTGEETFNDRGTNAIGLQIYNCDISNILNYKYSPDVKGISNKGLFGRITSGTSNMQESSDQRGLYLYYMSAQPNSRYIYFVGYTLSEIIGLTIQLPLNEPTTEQGTSFPENIEVDDYGMMYWLDGDGNFVTTPQGCKFFYPADYVLLIDDLNNYTNGDVETLAKKTDLASDKTELQGVDSQLLNAIGGALRQLLATKESLDFDNTAFVDLGELNWTYYATSPSHFSATLTDVKIGTAKILCTKYKAVASGGSSITIDKTINVHNGSAYVQIKDDAYTDATAFKNAMKGVLLAYEKASS